MQTPGVRKAGSGKGRLDLTSRWQETYESERDYIRALLIEHRSCKAAGAAIGVSKSAFNQKVKHHGIKLTRGWKGGFVE